MHQLGQRESLTLLHTCDATIIAYTLVMPLSTLLIGNSDDSLTTTTPIECGGYLLQFAACIGT
eukprot:scaffold9987_cov145-Skeletonema_marinoi.AAC.6